MSGSTSVPYINYKYDPAEHLERIRTQKGSLKLRRDIQESQNRKNYINEYDRLRAEIAMMPATSADAIRLQHRADKLKQLSKIIELNM